MTAAVRPPHVAAVLVSHDGARWLPAVLDAVAAQDRPPDELMAVDTSSVDDSAARLTSWLGPAAVLSRPATCGFGAAVAAALEALGPSPTDPTSSWVWLLHDDSAPAPDALDRLLAAAEAGDDVAVVGPKTREWPSLRRLLEVGVTITGTGSRETGLERGEPDQGQHDEPRDVLAVNTAGLLVRRDAWDELGGLEPLLPLFGDDLDFGWRAARAGYRTRVAPDAVVFHVEAASRGLRPLGVSRMRVAALRRRAALLVLLTNARPRAVAWQAVRLLFGSVLRAVGLLVAKAPREALDELRGLVSVYGRPWRLVRARRRRRAAQSRPPEVVRRLLPSPLLPYRHGLDTLAHVAVSVLGLGRGSRPAGRRAVETGPIAEEAQELASSPSLLSRIVTRPWASLLAVLVLLALWWARDLLGSGQLQGGALVPAPDGVGSWWALHLQPWHPVGIGSDSATAPYVLLLAVGGTLTLGQPWLLVDLLVLGAAPLCACTAFLLARSAFVDRRVRLAWAAGYALAPVLTGAVAQGRLGTLVALVVAPLLASAVLSTVRPARWLPWWQQAARIGIWLTVATAFAPVSYVLGAGAIVLTAVWWPRLSALPGLLGGLAAPWALLGSWMAERVLDVERMWVEAGRADVVVEPSGWRELAAGLAGGPGQPPVWIGLLVVAGVLVALLGGDRNRELLGVWAVAACGLALAVHGSGQRIEPTGYAGDAAVWVGLPAAVWLAGSMAVLALAADGAAKRLAGSAFGRRQLVAALTGVLLLAVPVTGAIWWCTAPDDRLLERSAAVRLPAYLAEQAAASQQASTLVLTGSVGEGVRWQVVRDDGLRLGEESVLPDGPAVDRFSEVVVGLVTSPGTDDVVFLLDHGVGAVLAPEPVDATLAAALDSAGGLQGAGTPDAGARAWELDAAAGSVRVVADGDAALAGSGLPTPAGLVGQLRTDSPAGSELRLAAGASGRWSATAAGADLDSQTTASGTQAFALSGSDPVHVQYESGRGELAWAQLLGLALLVLLALPGRRRAA